MLLHSPFFTEKIHASHVSKFLKIALVIHITILIPFTKVKYKLTYLQEYLLNLHSEQNQNKTKQIRVKGRTNITL